MPQVSMTVNGRKVSGEVEGRTLLVDFLRETLRLTGTHVGCDTAQCGACVVHMNGNSIKSCNIFALEADGSDVTTIEGIAGKDGSRCFLQAAFPTPHRQQLDRFTTGKKIETNTHHKYNPDPKD